MIHFKFPGHLAATIFLATPLLVSRVVAAPAPPPDVHPIVDAQRGYLLGGSIKGKWIKGDQVAHALRGGESYRLYKTTQRLEKAVGGKPEKMDGPCEDGYSVSIKPAHGEVALCGSWNALPRVPLWLGKSQSVYRAAVAAVLKQHGIKHPNIQITQLLRVDLDGDKTNEVLIEASNYANYSKTKTMSPDTKRGEYSMVLLRKLVKGKVKTTVLALEAYSEPKTFNAPSIHNISALLDLNGDGRMEIVLHSMYYEGDSTAVLELQGDKVVTVLEAGCGA